MPRLKPETDHGHKVASDVPITIIKDRGSFAGCVKQIDGKDSMALQQPVKTRASLQEEPFKFAGYLGTLFACLLASLGVLCLKLLPVENTIQEKAKACMLRGAFMSIFCAITVIHQGHSFKIPKGEYWVNISRAILGALNTFLVFVAVQYITIGECSALKYSSPVWTCLMGFLILKERIPISLILALPLSMLGIILLAHPGLILDIGGDLTAGLKPENYNEIYPNTFTHNSSFNLADLNETVNDNSTNIVELLELPLEQEIAKLESYFDRRLPGIAAALGSSLCISASIIVLKFRKKTPISTNSFYMGLTTLIVAFLIQTLIGFGQLPVTCLEWFIHVCIGFFAYSVQCVLQWSLQYTPAGSYSVIRSMDIVIGFILGAIFLSDSFMWTSIVGSILIMIVITMLIFDSYIESALKCLWNRIRGQPNTTQVTMNNKQ